MHCKQLHIHLDKYPWTELLQDSVWKPLVHAATSWKVFVSCTGGLFTFIMVCSKLGDLKQTNKKKKTCDDGKPWELLRIRSVSGWGPPVNIFGNMKLIFAVFLLVTVGCVALSFLVWEYVIWSSSDKELCMMTKFFSGGRAKLIPDQNCISSQVHSLRGLMEPKNYCRAV